MVWDRPDAGRFANPQSSMASIIGPRRFPVWLKRKRCGPDPLMQTQGLRFHAFCRRGERQPPRLRATNGHTVYRSTAEVTCRASNWEIRPWIVSTTVRPHATRLEGWAWRQGMRSSMRDVGCPSKTARDLMSKGRTEEVLLSKVWNMPMAFVESCEKCAYAFVDGGEMSVN